MKLGSNLMCLHNRRGPIMLAAGFFDGVHRGHQAIIRNMVRDARRKRAEAWVMTFDTHPLKILSPAAAPKLLTSTPHKLSLLKGLGIQGCIVMHFTQALARRKPEEFIATLARSAPTLRKITIGQNWTFGWKGRGTPALLKTMAPVYGFKVTVIPPVCWRGKAVSSTRIRAAVLAGRLKDAAEMLGRPFGLLGTVVSGQGLGRKLGIPTANLDPHNEVAPPEGVYIISAHFNGVDYPGIANFGVRPTIHRLRTAICRLPSVVRCPSSAVPAPSSVIRPQAIVLELHLFKMRRNLYGKSIEVTFLKKLRPERIFPSLTALQRQIRKDIEQAQAWFESKDKGTKGQRHIGTKLLKIKARHGF